MISNVPFCTSAATCVANRVRVLVRSMALANELNICFWHNSVNYAFLKEFLFSTIDETNRRETEQTGAGDIIARTSTLLLTLFLFHMCILHF